MHDGICSLTTAGALPSSATEVRASITEGLLFQIKGVTSLAMNVKGHSLLLPGGNNPYGIQTHKDFFSRIQLIDN